MHKSALVALVLVILPAHAAPLRAQTQQGAPARPQMAAGADTNDAQLYYDLGIMHLAKQPKVAAEAFWWSARLNPTRAEAFYAQRVAQLLMNPDRLARYWRGDRGTLRSKDIRRIDSLYLRALMLNPFFYEGLERKLQDGVIWHIARSSPGESSSEIEYQIQRYLAQAGPGEQAFRAYGDGRFNEALDLYARAIRTSRTKYGYRMMRGRLFAQLGKPDSALAELTLAVQEMRKEDAKDLVYVYQSKALVEQAIGMLQLRVGDREKAKEAYARALQEDLAYASAHAQLGYLALELGDSVTAVSEFDLAVQLRPDDEALRYQYGTILTETGRLDEADAQYRKAIELNPVFALPHQGLGRVHDRRGNAAEASASYRTFLAMSSRREPKRAEVENRLRALAGS